jgi:hypothetical protein
VPFSPGSCHEPGPKARSNESPSSRASYDEASESIASIKQASLRIIARSGTAGGASEIDRIHTAGDVHVFSSPSLYYI